MLLLPQKFWDDVPKTVTALRDKTLLHYDPEHIVRIDRQSRTEHTVISRTERGHYQL